MPKLAEEDINSIIVDSPIHTSYQPKQSTIAQKHQSVPVIPNISHYLPNVASRQPFSKDEQDADPSSSPPAPNVYVSKSHSIHPKALPTQRHSTIVAPNDIYGNLGGSPYSPSLANAMNTIYEGSSGSTSPTMIHSRQHSIPTIPRPSSFLLPTSQTLEFSDAQEIIPASRKSSLSAIQRFFYETNSSVPTFVPPPQSSELRVFWLMRCLETSMVSGGYITKRLYVPKHLWYQDGIKIPAIEMKSSSCEIITSCLEKFQNINFKDPYKVLRELEGFDHVLTSVQNGLAKKLPFIQPLKRPSSSSALLSFGNKLTKSMKMQLLQLKTNQSHVTSLYINNASKLFKTSQFLEQWYIHYSSKVTLDSLNSQVLTRLNTVTGFFNCVICAFVLRDLSILLYKHNKRAKLYSNE